jgi:hypothetical protein
MDLVYLPIIILTVLVLGYIAYQDMRAREINIVYLIVLALISIIYLGSFVFKLDFGLWKNYLIQIAIVLVFVLIFFILGKITKFAYIGEGDLYTVLALSFTNIYSSLFVIFVFLIALLFMLGIPIFLFIYNLIRGNYPRYNVFQSIGLMLLGTPKKISDLDEFDTPLEEITYKDNKIIKHPKFSPNFNPINELRKIKELSREHEIKYIWVSPLLPFVLLILLSYIFIILTLFIVKSPVILSYLSLLF